MDKEQVFLQPAFVLHQRPYRNTSVIVDIFTREFGRLSLVAKGVKRRKSALKSVLQNFQILRISWVKRSDLGVLTSAEFQGHYIKLDQEKIYSALYLNEILIRLLQVNEVVPELFDAYKDTLRALNDNLSVPIVLRLFEKQLLQSLGYEMQLSHDAKNQSAIEAEKIYEYVPELGFVEATATSASLLHFKGAHLLAFNANQIEQSDVLKTAHQLTHLNLKRLLGEKPLKSRELFRAYKAIK